MIVVPRDDDRIDIYNGHGGPGQVFMDASGRVLGVMALTVVDGVVTSVDAVVNRQELSMPPTITAEQAVGFWPLRDSCGDERSR